MAYIRNISGTYMNYIGNIYEIGYMGSHFAIPFTQEHVMFTLVLNF